MDTVLPVEENWYVKNHRDVFSKEGFLVHGKKLLCRGEYVKRL